MKRRKRVYRKGLKGFWLNGIPAYRVPILNQPKIKLTEEEKEKFDRTLKDDKTLKKDRKRIINIKKGDFVNLRNGKTKEVVKADRWYFYLGEEKYWRNGNPVDGDYKKQIVRKIGK